MSGCQNAQTATCTIALNESDYFVGEAILIEFSTLAIPRDNRIFESLMNGTRKIQIFQDSKMIYETEMWPISAPKITREKLSFFHQIPTRGPDFKAIPGKYKLKAIVDDWSSNEVEFMISQIELKGNLSGSEFKKAILGKWKSVWEHQGKKNIEYLELAKTAKQK